VLDAIGRRGRLSRAALCTDSRGMVSGIGGWTVRLRRVRFQSRSGRKGARRSHLVWLGCRAGAAVRRALDVVHGRVRHEVNG
jgi:hypothetical protein